MTDENSTQEIAAAGDAALTQASMLFDAEFKKGTLNFTAGINGERKRFEFARAALTHAEEVTKLNPGAVFTYEGSEMFLSDAVDHLRKTIKRAEELYDK